MSLFKELKRRNVIRVGLAYIVTAWLLLQIADVVINNIEAPGWVFQAIMLVIGLGFPLAVVFAWAYEMTPEGIKKEADVDRSDSITNTTGRKLDLAIIIALVAAVVYFAVDKFGLDDVDDQAQSADTTVTAKPATALATAAPDKSIAVLPFVNMSSDPEQEFFSDGISEELLNVLAQFPKLRVAARTSSFQFKGENLDVGKIAETLNVAHILEGSVRKSGTRLRITAQLIKADDGYHLWSETYDRDMDDIFTIQDEIAAAISEALKAELSLGTDDDGTLTRPAVIQASNTQAYEAYLRGRRLIHMRGRESLEDAVRHLERSLRLDANYAPAHAQLAIGIALLLESPDSYGNLSLAEVSRRVVPHIERAFELSPNLPEANAAQALLHLDLGDSQAVLQYTRKALAVNPSYTDAMNWQRSALLSMSRYKEADELMVQILEVDPLNIVGRLNYAGTLQGRRKIDEAHAVADSLLEQSPWASYSAHASVAIYAEAEVAKGLDWVLRAYAADPGDMLSNTYLVDAFSWIGAYDEARRISDTLVPWVDLAEGKDDDAVAAIEEKRQSDPDNRQVLRDVAAIYYFTRNFDKAYAVLEQLAAMEPAGRPIQGSISITILLASGRKQAGDQGGADEAIKIVEAEIRAFEEAGFAGPGADAVRGLLAVYYDDSDEAIHSFRKAVDRGWRDPTLFSNPFLDAIRDDERFIAIESDTLQALAIEREKALQFICFDNPAPGAWQPLPETCEGVVEQPLEL